MKPSTWFAVVGVVCAGWAQATVLDPLARAVQEFSLPNGLRVVVLERHSSPVVSAALRINTGAAGDPAGKRGVARSLEQTYWEGGEGLSSRNLKEERAAIARTEELLDLRDAELRRGATANLLTAEDHRLKAKMQMITAAAQGERQFLRTVLERNAASQIRSLTDSDSINLGCTLPSNRAELWWKLTGDWLKQPTYRNFYLNRDALRDAIKDRRETLLVEKWTSALLQAAFAGQPYEAMGAPVEEFDAIRIKDAEEFRARYIRPDNAIVTVVGDVTVDQARQWAQTYLGGLTGKDGSKAAGVEWPKESKAPEARQLAVQHANEAIWVGAWLRPAGNDQDDAAFDVVTAVLAGARASLLHQALMGEVPLAIQVQAAASFPGEHGQALFVLVVSPAPGATAADIGQKVSDTLKKLRSEPLAEALVERARRYLDKRLLEECATNMSTVNLLGRAVGGHGSFAKFMEGVARLDAVKPADVQRVAGRYLTDEAMITLVGGAR